jgi:hypothetical protein
MVVVLGRSNPLKVADGWEKLVSIATERRDIDVVHAAWAAEQQDHVLVTVFVLRPRLRCKLALFLALDAIGMNAERRTLTTPTRASATRRRERANERGGMPRLLG